MDIQRPDIKKKKMQRQVIAGGIGVVVLAAAAFFVSRLKPASPTVDRATVWTDAVKQGPLLRQVRALSDRLASLMLRVERKDPSANLAIARRRLESAEQCMERLAGTLISARATVLEHAWARLQALSPLAVLSRGYALVYGPDGTLLRDAAAVKPGDTVRARLADGSVEAQVTKSGG